MWQVKQDDDYFQVDNGSWSQMVQTLGLTKAQVAKLRSRKNRAIEVCDEIEKTRQEVKRLKVTLEILQRRPLDSVAVEWFQSGKN